MKDVKDILLPLLQKIIYYVMKFYNQYPSLSIIIIVAITIIWYFKKPVKGKREDSVVKKEKGNEEGSLKKLLDNPWVFVVIMLLVLVPKAAQNKDVEQFAQTGMIAQAETQNENPIDTSIVKSEQDFINTIAEYACKDEGIFPSVTIAQACLESAFGKSNLASRSNNLFGMKVGSNWCGEYVIANDDSPTDRFRKYSNWNESIKDHSRLIKCNYYAKYGVLNAKTPEEQVACIKNAGYATDKDYVSKIINNYINKYNLKVFDRLKNQRPVEGNITSNFGNRIAPIRGASKEHHGIDIKACTGTKVKSLIGGTVKQYSDSPSGNYVIVTNGQYEEVFCHLSKMYNINNVNAGDFIGEVGNTGTATTGAHLHYGFRVNKIYIDPLKYIKQ